MKEEEERTNPKIADHYALEFILCMVCGLTNQYRQSLLRLIILSAFSQLKPSDLINCPVIFRPSFWHCWNVFVRLNFFLIFIEYYFQFQNFFTLFFFQSKTFLNDSLIDFFLLLLNCFFGSNSSPHLDKSIYFKSYLCVDFLRRKKKF